MADSDKRRSKRFLCRLVVDFHGKGSTRSLTTSNVSRHGIFVTTPEPPPERHVMQLSLHTPQGRVRATAWVSRCVNDHSEPHRRGAGLQFFSLGTEDKQRWDDFFFRLSEDLASKLAVGSGSGGDDRIASNFIVSSFVVKLGDEAKLFEFDKTCLAHGAMFLVTPVLKPVGTKVGLHLVHPQTDEEFVLAGTVARLHARRPKGMEIHMPDLTRKVRESFREFIRTGEPLLDELSVRRPEPTVPSVRVPLVSDTGTIDDEPFEIDLIDEDELAPGAIFEWADIAEELTVDLDIDDEVQIDFDHHDFEHRDVEHHDFDPHDFDINTATGHHLPSQSPAAADDGATAPGGQKRAAHEFAQGFGQEPASAEELLERLGPSLAVNVECDGCDLKQTLHLGPSEGLLGLVADDVPLWDPVAQRLVAWPRLAPARQRRERLERLAGPKGVPGHLQVPLDLIFAIVGLREAPTSSQGTPLIGGRSVRELEKCFHQFRQEIVEKSTEAAEDDAQPQNVTFSDAACPQCESGRWRVEFLSMPE